MVFQLLPFGKEHLEGIECSHAAQNGYHNQTKKLHQVLSRMWRNRTFVHCGVNANDVATMENIMKIAQKTKTRTTI